ncbi:hypothetical protein CSUI_006600, partial [Cystoisospora suis]
VSLPTALHDGTYCLRGCLCCCLLEEGVKGGVE